MKHRLQFTIIAIWVIGCGSNVDDRMSASVPFTTSEHCDSADLEVHVPNGIHIISLFLFIPPEYRPVKGDDIHVDVTIWENGVQRRNYPVKIDLSEQAILQHSVPTIAPGDREALARYRSHSESSYYSWPYYSAIDSREGRLYREDIGSGVASMSGKIVRVHVRFLERHLLPEELRSWQLRIDPYTGK